MGRRRHSLSIEYCKAFPYSPTLLVAECLPSLGRNLVYLNSQTAITILTIWDCVQTCQCWKVHCLNVPLKQNCWKRVLVYSSLLPNLAVFQRTTIVECSLDSAFLGELASSETANCCMVFELKEQSRWCLLSQLHPDWRPEIDYHFPTVYFLEGSACTTWYVISHPLTSLHAYEWLNCYVIWKQKTLKSTGWMNRGRSYGKHCRCVNLQPGIPSTNKTLRCLNGFHDMVI